MKKAYAVATGSVYVGCECDRRGCKARNQAQKKAGRKAIRREARLQERA